MKRRRRGKRRMIRRRRRRRRRRGDEVDKDEEFEDWEEDDILVYPSRTIAEKREYEGMKKVEEEEKGE